MKNILMIYLLLQMLFPSGVLASENNTGIQDVLILPGQYLKAVLVAYEDFQNMLKEEFAKSRQDDFSIFYSKIENYEVIIRESERKYFISFRPKHSVGYRVRGGGGEYVIDKITFNILKKIYTE